MKRTLTLAIALGVTLAVVVAGSASSLPLNLGGGVTVNVPTGGVLPACMDGIDNDGDGLVDMADPGCTSPLDTSEYNPPSGGGTTTGGGAAPTPGGGGKAKPGGGSKGKKIKNQSKAAGGLTGGILGPHGKGKAIPQQPTVNPNGSPTNANPTLSVAQFGPAPIGVPNFIIDQFEIPPFLLPIYQACGTQYDIPWEILASINRIETAFGTNLNTSTAGAVGWMQFLPSTWKAYGVDANNDGQKDPYNPVDAICAAARYLKAAGGSANLQQAIFAYNPASWYVDEVILYAKQYGKLPDSLVGSLTGLTEGAHFPVAAKARYADDLSARTALRDAKQTTNIPHNAAQVISSSPTRRGINIYSRVNAPVVAVNDGVIKKMGESKRLGKFIVLEDAYGNRYTYAQLGSIAPVHPVPKQQKLSPKDFKLVQPKAAPKPTQAASAGSNTSVRTKTYGNVRSLSQANNSESRRGPTTAKSGPAPAKSSSGGPVDTQQLRARLFGSGSQKAAAPASGQGLGSQLDALLGNKVPGYETFKATFTNAFKFDAKTMQLKPLKVGSKVTGGTVLGRIGRSGNVAPHINFAIRPVGKGAPTIDPKPILDGWKLLESTAIYRAAGKNPFVGGNPTVGQVLLMSQQELEQRALADPGLSIYSCGRTDIQTGQINRRVLAVMEYLIARGYKLTITSLKCGHSFLTSSGNVSAHSSGDAVDIAAVNGIPITGHQGPGSITEMVVKDLLGLQGTMRPAQIISLMSLGGPSFALPDHYNHIHVGYTPEFGTGIGQQLAQVLKPDQWARLIGRLGQIKNPTVPIKPSTYAIPAKPHSGSQTGD